METKLERKRRAWREWYHRNKTQANSDRSARLKKERKLKRKWLDGLKMESGCIRCGYRESPVALHFHHVDPETKRFNVSNVLRGYCRASILAEIEKCEILCANCHAIETAWWGVD